MPKDNAPVIGGAGGGIFAWFHEQVFIQIIPTFMSEIFKVALFAFVGASIGELVKLGITKLKKHWEQKRKRNG